MFPRPPRLHTRPYLGHLWRLVMFLPALARCLHTCPFTARSVLSVTSFLIRYPGSRKASESSLHRRNGAPRPSGLVIHTPLTRRLFFPGLVFEALDGGDLFTPWSYSLAWYVTSLVSLLCSLASFVRFSVCVADLFSSFIGYLETVVYQCVCT